MTKNDIIAELFVSKDFNDCIGKMKPVNLQDDLKAEVALILCEKDDALIIGLHARKELKYYTVRIILNMIQSNSSPFYRKFRHVNNIIAPVNHIDARSARTYDFQAIEAFKLPSEYDIEYDQICLNKNIESYQSLLGIGLFDYDDRPDKAIEAIDSLYWYDREILKLYGKLGTYRKVEEETGIPFESVYKTVQRGCRAIRKKVA